MKSRKVIMEGYWDTLQKKVENASTLESLIIRRIRNVAKNRTRSFKIVEGRLAEHRYRS